jgi:small-conductance mechanosensitive channel
MKKLKQLIKNIGIIVLISFFSYLGFLYWQKYFESNNLKQLLLKIINYQVYMSNNIGISLGTLISAIILIIIGLFLSKIVTNFLVAKILKKTELDTGLKMSIQKITNYILIMLFSIFALDIAGVPLTVLTIFGGALAIGFGFGTQNIVNNFISGLIIQLDRSTKIGDFIEIDGLAGSIIEISARYFKILTTNNTVAIIPNSFLLDKKVINWSDKQTVRLQINIGFSNQIEFSQINNLIKTIMDEYPSLKNQLIVVDFSDSYILYSLFVWMPIENNLDKIIKESNIRQKIQELSFKNQFQIFIPKEKKEPFIFN